MKYIIICLFILFSNRINAQQSPFLVTNFTINGKTFKCEQEYGSTHIYNQQNLSRHREPESHPKPYCNMARLDYPKIRNVLYTVFNATQRATFKLNDTSLGITFYIAPTTGEIKEMTFYVGKNTPFTQDNIYQLETGLKGLIMPSKPPCAPMTWIVFPLSVYWE